MTTMIGNRPDISLKELFLQQMANQKVMLDFGMYNDFKQEGTKMIPADDVKLSSYHIQQLISEVGEVLDADKRWKNFRNTKYDKDAKAEEIADCFIVLMNIAMFSDVDADKLVQAIQEKLNIVSERIAQERTWA